MRHLISEQPQHEVRLTKGYWIDRHEVTNEAFGKFLEVGGYRTRSLGSESGREWLKKESPGQLPASCEGNAPNHPVPNHRVDCVSWYEAEWEFAARGFWSLAYPRGNAFKSSLAKVVESEGLKPVGSYPQGTSWVGAQDMAGNVMEWVQDWLGNYSAESVEDPIGPASGAVKVEKGGWWGGPYLAPRSEYRHFEDPPDYGDHHIGFRVATP
ncbi:MAG: formylglycine-generating enzyme family protein [Steroidobacteraceae bacterium]